MKSSAKTLIVKNFLLSAVAALATCSAVSAQGFGVKAGVNISHFSNSPESHPIARFTGGVFVDFKLSRKSSLSVDLLYSGQGAKFDWISGESRLQKMGYLNLPILFNYYIVRGLAVKTGIQPGYLVFAKLGNDASGTSGFTQADLTIPVGLVFDARYNIGTVDVFAPLDGHSSSNPKRNNFFSLTAGWFF